MLHLLQCSEKNHSLLLNDHPAEYSGHGEKGSSSPNGIKLWELSQVSTYLLWTGRSKMQWGRTALNNRIGQQQGNDLPSFTSLKNFLDGRAIDSNMSFFPSLFISACRSKAHLPNCHFLWRHEPHSFRVIWVRESVIQINSRVKSYLIVGIIFTYMEFLNQTSVYLLPSNWFNSTGWCLKLDRWAFGEVWVSQPCLSKVQYLLFAKSERPSLQTSPNQAQNGRV